MLHPSEPGDGPQGPNDDQLTTLKYDFSYGQFESVTIQKDVANVSKIITAIENERDTGLWLEMAGGQTFSYRMSRTSQLPIEPFELMGTTSNGIEIFSGVGNLHDLDRQMVVWAQDGIFIAATDMDDPERKLSIEEVEAFINGITITVKE